MLPGILISGILIIATIINNETKINFTSEHSLLFNTTKDLKSDFTQFYNLNYTYETDCLAAHFDYHKKFFSNSQLKPDESFMFLIKF